MASVKFDPAKGTARVFFRFRGRQYNKSVKAENARAADRIRAAAEETISDIERGKLVMPDDADPVAFIISGGKRTVRRAVADDARATTLGDLFQRYEADPPPHLEGSTRKMQQMHSRRVLEVFPRTDLQAFDKATAQTYILKRSRMKYRERPIHRETIAKELKTLRQVWAWVAARSPGIKPPPFTLKELSFPKAAEQRPFMSWSEIEREIQRGGLTDAEVGALWDCLWLDKFQVRELLAHVETVAAYPFIAPLFYFAAYTGARRSELSRSRISDWKFETNTVKLRQKKRDKDKEFSFRDVHIHPKLSEVMRAWFDVHPGGPYTVCQADGSKVTWDAATFHFKKTLAGSKWEVVRGWHVLRHSFASNLAAAGVDQRKIDLWMGHSTDVRWRYQHIRPQDQLDAISVL